MTPLQLALQPQLSGLINPPNNNQLFPALNNLDEVMNLAESMKPITTYNQLYSLIMITKNTVNFNNIK